MFDVEQLQTDKGREEEGVWIPLGDDDSTALKIAAWGNDRHAKLVMKKNRKHAQQKELGLLSEEREREINMEMIAETILLDWRGLAKGGKPLPYSKKAAKELLLTSAPLRTLVITEAQKQENFLRREVEAISKNSSSGSDGKSGAEPPPVTSESASGKAS